MESDGDGRVLGIYERLKTTGDWARSGKERGEGKRATSAWIGPARGVGRGAALMGHVKVEAGTGNDQRRGGLPYGGALAVSWLAGPAGVGAGLRGCSGQNESGKGFPSLNFLFYFKTQFKYKSNLNMVSNTLFNLNKNEQFW